MPNKATDAFISCAPQGEGDNTLTCNDCRETFGSFLDHALHDRGGSCDESWLNPHTGWVRHVEDGIVDAGDEGVILTDGDARDEVHCGARFAPSDAAGAMFDGSTGRYRCPVRGKWSDGPPPGS